MSESLPDSEWEAQAVLVALAHSERAAVRDVEAEGERVAEGESEGEREPVAQVLPLVLTEGDREGVSVCVTLVHAVGVAEEHREGEGDSDRLPLPVEHGEGEGDALEERLSEPDELLLTLPLSDADREGEREGEDDPLVQLEADALRVVEAEALVDRETEPDGDIVKRKELEEVCERDQ